VKILVSGASGALGKRLVRVLLEKGFGVRALARNKEGLREAFGSLAMRASAPAVEAIALDLETVGRKELKAACDGVGAVVHLAALVDYSASRERLLAANAEATRKLVEAAKAAGVKKFVFVSSTSVYRKPRYLPVDERHEMAWENAYGESKALAEKAVRESGVPFVILRPCLIFGPGFEKPFKQAAALIARGRMPVMGSGKNRVALVHCDDVVKAIASALERAEALQQDFIIAGGALAQERLLEIVAEELRAPRPSLHVPARLAYALAGAYSLAARAFGKKPFFNREAVGTLAQDRFYSTEKARRLLGFEPRNLEESVREFAGSLA